MVEKRQMGLAEAAKSLGIPYQDCHRLLLTGSLRGEKRKGRWFVDADDVAGLAGKDPGQPPTRHAAGSAR